ncbi:MAG: ParB-like nuclease domain-containing protein [Candidatus Diapherotrites archaeon]|nr:ParB-like nuclease domain-containing protein [Candidatus Diapherotrites archaeon]
MTLIQPHEERDLFDKILEYYHSLHEEVKFVKREEMLSPAEIKELYYTLPSLENVVTYGQKVEEIKRAIGHGYNTPVIVLRKRDRDLLIDGHRRIRAAWELGIEWPALIMVPDKQKEFGVEKLAEGKIGDLWEK